jgi:predicted acylesterase/phospholipase RssA
MATCIDSGEGVALGGDGWSEVPLSRAIRASAAAPGLYAPVLVQGRRLIDGAVARTSHTSLACEQGLDVLICINPIAPSPRAAIGHVDHSLIEILNRSVRHVMQLRFRAEVQEARARFPQATLLVIEPAEDDPSLDEFGLFDLDACSWALEEGYRSASRQVARLTATA